MASERDRRYLELLVQPIRVCVGYMPKFGRARGTGTTLSDFQTLYGQDPFYAWFGLDNPLMYAAHKAAGGMTSIYRQIGIGCERLFREILRDELRLTAEQCRWSYVTKGATGRTRTLSLDARIPLESVGETRRRKLISAWMRQVAQESNVNERIIRALRGVVFEVRQAYKSKDSKRQNADIANAATAYSEGYLPCALVLSSQFDDDILSRYRAARWIMLTGRLAGASSTDSTYVFVNDVIGFDLAGFFERQKDKLRQEIEVVLAALLSAR